ncbi:MAG: hypothetical protein WD096_06300 [Actinomycetota bacterium]
MIGTDWFFVIFRLIHISSGVVWVGMVFFFVFFLQPSAAAIGPAAGPMMGQLLGVRKLVDRLLMLAAATVAAGLVLYVEHAVDAGLGTWLGSAYGLGLTIGMVTAIAAMGIGASVTRPNVRRLMAIQQEVAASGGPPSPEQGARIGLIQGTLKAAARISLGLLGIATVTMATARYW